MNKNKYTTFSVYPKLHKELKRMVFEHDLKYINEALLLLLKEHKKECKKCLPMK